MKLMDYLSVTPTVVSQINEVADMPATPSPATNDRVALPDFEKAAPEIPSDSIDFNKLIREKGYYGAFLSLNKKPDFDAEEKRTKRERTLSLIGDIATLGGQSLASAMGARRFTPIKSQVPQYNERLQRLRDAKKAYDTDFNNKSLSMAFRDFEQKKADDSIKMKATSNQVAADLKFKRDLTMKQIDQAFQVGMLDTKGKKALEAQASRAKSIKELEGLKHQYRLSEIVAGKKNDKTKGDLPKKTYPKMRIEGPNGESTYYDINDDVQAAKMYNEGVRVGYFKKPINERPTVKQMRDEIVGSANLWKGGNSGNLGSNGGLGWGNNNKTDW